MHDPLVVAFTIRRPPWPLARRAGHWPAMVIIWHREPGGHDAGEVCKQHRHDPATGWTFYHGWRFHIKHWKIQVVPLQNLRRRLLTRCEWCGGRSRKRDSVNVSHTWDGLRSPWWRGERGLFHMDCSSVKRAHVQCLCEDPLLEHGDYGRCALCSKFRPWRNATERALPQRLSVALLASLPEGSRIPSSMRPQLEALWAQERAERAQ